MNIPQVVISDTVSIYLLLTLLMEAKFKDILGEKEGIRLKQLIYLTMISSVLDIILTMSDGKSGVFMYFLNYYGNTVLFVTPILIAWCWLSFIFLFYKRLNDFKTGNWFLTRFLMIPGIVSLGAGAVQLFVPVLFRVDQENYYHRLNLSWLSVGVVFFYIFAGILIFYGRKAPAYFRTGNIWMFVFPIIGGTIFQFTFYGVSVIFPSVTLGLTGFYISCHNEIMMRDWMTGLLNRTCFMSAAVQKICKENPNAGIIMLDVDRFKEINDRFGHLEGDHALKLVADVLKEAADDDDLVFRFGGDEFLFLTCSEDPEHLENTKQKLLAGVREINAEGTLPYRLSLSCGTAVNKGNGMNLENVLNAADFIMYSQKNGQARPE